MVYHTGLERLGPYVLTRPLGPGGMADVYLAFDWERRRPVVVKVLKAEFLSDSALLRFDRELKVGLGLRHPHLVATLAGGLIEGRPYLVMEYGGETDLQRLVDDR